MAQATLARRNAVAFWIWTLLAVRTWAGTQVVLEDSVSQSVGDGKLGAVASEHQTCSQIGIDLLGAGGNAADALVGTVVCVGVIGTYHSGVGGGGYMLIRSSNGSYEVIDFRETAPAAAYENMFKDNLRGSMFGGLASAVPGQLRGLEYLHRTYGSLPWSDLIKPAIKVARDGFPVGPTLVSAMDYAVSVLRGFNFLKDDPAWAEDFAPNGTLVGLGDTMTRKRYADTLETIAHIGPSAFYQGAIAETTIRAIQKANGTMTLEDLEKYTVVSREPVEIDYRGYRIHACGLVASGAVTLSALKTIEGYDGMGDQANLNLSTHRLVEAMRFAYGERASMGDPDFNDGMQSLQNNMLDEHLSSITRGKISDEHTLNVSDYDPSGFESVENHGTSHMVAADVSGMAISLTTTINTMFGSQLMVPETGIIMNNLMNDFSVPNVSNFYGYHPSPANYIRPRKRPLSSQTPAIVEHASNRSFYYAIGATGGSRIITTTVQNLWHVLDQGMSVPQALAQPRLHDQLLPNYVDFEWGFDNGTVAFMKARGHNVTWVPPGLSTAQGLRRLGNGTFEAAGEPRLSESGGLAL